jgi:hypothetical protein
MFFSGSGKDNRLLLNMMRKMMIFLIRKSCLYQPEIIESPKSLFQYFVIAGLTRNPSNTCRPFSEDPASSAG